MKSEAGERGHRWAFPLVMAVARHCMYRRFCGAWAMGCEHLPGKDAARALLACAGHTNWWDGFAAGLASARLMPEREFSLMQEARHLAKYPFFKAAGVFGIELDGMPLAGFREAVRRLRSPRAVLWMFPQGKFCASDEPVVVRPGAERLAALTRALILPVWFHYVWMFESRPALVVEFGRPMEADESGELASALESLRMSVAWKSAAENGTSLLPRSLSLNKIWEMWARRLGIIQPDHPFEKWNR